MRKALLAVALAGLLLLSVAQQGQARSLIGTCTVHLGSVINGQPRLLVQGYGLQPNFTYEEGIKGYQSAFVTTDASGYSSNQSLFYNGPADYYVEFVYLTGTGKHYVYDAQCSAHL